jgi:hypothetical protein
MLTKMKLAFALCASLIGGGVALADNIQGGGSGGGRGAWMQKYDTNGDGQIDAQEREAMKADRAAKREARKEKMLAKYDTNKDGKLDASERAVMRDERQTARFEKMDLNKDGQISLDEFKAFKSKHARGGFGRHHHKPVNGLGTK